MSTVRIALGLQGKPFDGFRPFHDPIRHGASSEISLAVFEDVFMRGALDQHRPFETVEYFDGRCEVYGAGRTPINSLMFSRFGGTTFWCRVLELTDRTGSMLIWPGDKDVAVTDLRLLDQLPQDLKADGWQPHLTRSVQRLVDVIGIIEDDGTPWRLENDWSL